MKVRPLGKRVLVKPVEEKEESASGLIIPDSAKGHVNYFVGQILDIGQEVSRVKTGDRVAYLKYGYDEVKVEGNVLRIVDEASLIAVYE